MTYIIINFIATFFIYLYHVYRDSKCNFYITGGMFIFFVFLLPAFQYNVGTDYESYKNIYENADVLDVFFDHNNEFLFYYYVKFCQLLGADYYGFIILTSLIQAIIIFNILVYLERKYYYSIVVVFFLFWTMTNMLHTQMNIIRASFAIYLFIFSVLLKCKENTKLSLLMVILAIGFHRSAFICLPFILIPVGFYRFAYKKILLTYFITIILFSTPILYVLMVFIVHGFLPYYEHYMISYESSMVSGINILTKLYWLPINLVFIYLIKNKLLLLGKDESTLVGFWVVTCNIFILMLHFDFISRVNFYFVFFYIIPIYYVFEYFRINTRFNYISRLICLVTIFLYCIIPYLLKVVLFPIAEFDYNTYLF